MGFLGRSLKSNFSTRTKKLRISRSYSRSGMTRCGRNRKQITRTSETSSSDRIAVPRANQWSLLLRYLPLRYLLRTFYVAFTSRDYGNITVQFWVWSVWLYAREIKIPINPFPRVLRIMLDYPGSWNLFWLDRNHWLRLNFTGSTDRSSTYNLRPILIEHKQLLCGLFCFLPIGTFKLGRRTLNYFVQILAYRTCCY